ncbi:sigma 54-interacting transcriptional regulator [Salidesulfovibrio onnuriiensis]|uniref:sigma 54-interacting transcriptional regulator n=1 Tax=Salidesulfovibrio onnuriiensis TaxID=2583823 RepID=UPI0011C747E3|nr:sigma 54-interacting transcriptional regulator [Salidesulfovibrio onnuriiensis]
MSTAVKNLKFMALLAICQIIDKALDLESALESVLRVLSEELSMKRATVTLLDDGRNTLNINASYGLTPEEKRRGVYSLGEGVTGAIFQSGEPYFVPDISKEPLFLNKTGTRIVTKAKLSFLGVPIKLYGEPIGVLNVDRLFADDISPEEDIEFLSVVATLIAQFISLNRKIEEREEVLRAENTSLKYQISKESNGLYMVGTSTAMMDVQRQLQRVAPTKATVLLGESGVGKTLIARIIHQLSDRKEHPFIKVNCASIPENLLESELFGVDKGAYTGASHSRAGRFEEANRGTIFLDEVGELPLAVQAKLLRVIQEKEFERLGSARTRRTDVRIVTATNKDLEVLSRNGEFRPDLYYRLNVFPIRVPALRERKEDVPGLLNHFLNRMADEYGRPLAFTSEALDTLTMHDWPGNVREMENLLERLVIMADSDRIDSAMLAGFLKGPARDAALQAPTPAPPSLGNRSLSDVERQEIVAALERNGWIQYKAARDLGLTPRQMGYRVHKFSLEPLIAQGRASLRN